MRPKLPREEFAIRRGSSQALFESGRDYTERILVPATATTPSIPGSGYTPRPMSGEGDTGGRRI